jgi:hypothetical protein
VFSLISGLLLNAFETVEIEKPNSLEICFKVAFVFIHFFTKLTKNIILIPSNDTSVIQVIQIVIGHSFCEYLENSTTK